MLETDLGVDGSPYGRIWGGSIGSPCELMAVLSPDNDKNAHDWSLWITAKLNAILSNDFASALHIYSNKSLSNVPTNAMQCNAPFLHTPAIKISKIPCHHSINQMNLQPPQTIVSTMLLTHQATPSHLPPQDSTGTGTYPSTSRS